MSPHMPASRGAPSCPANGPEAVPVLCPLRRLRGRRSWLRVAAVSGDRYLGPTHPLCSPGVRWVLRDVALGRLSERFRNTSARCGARSRRCSQARPAQSRNKRNTSQGRWREVDHCPTRTIHKNARFISVLTPREPVPLAMTHLTSEAHKKCELSALHRSLQDRQE